MFNSTERLSDYFNPRSPHGERHYIRLQFCSSHIDISIHAPRTGSDLQIALNRATKQIFQSTLPARGATYTAIVKAFEGVFQSTLPARGATTMLAFFQILVSDFNPRSPHGERHIFCRRKWRILFNFNPRSPHGERHAQLFYAFRIIYFNPRSPHGERQLYLAPISVIRGISIHAPRTGSDV